MIHLCLAKMSETGMEQKYIQEAFDTQWVAPLGPKVDAFEKNLEAFLSCHLDHPTCHFERSRALELCSLATGGTQEIS